MHKILFKLKFQSHSYKCSWNLVLQLANQVFHFTVSASTTETDCRVPSSKKLNVNHNIQVLRQIDVFRVPYLKGVKWDPIILSLRRPFVCLFVYLSVCILSQGLYLGSCKTQPVEIFTDQVLFVYANIKNAKI